MQPTTLLRTAGFSWLCLLVSTPSSAQIVIGNGACNGFASTPCTQPSGCTGMTVCELFGAIRCDSSGSKVACAACGANGFSVCTSHGALSDCRAAVARPEECNGCDDNHDGQTDEQLPQFDCVQPNGCSGKRSCPRAVPRPVYTYTPLRQASFPKLRHPANGYGECANTPQSVAPCTACGGDGRRACFADGTIGTCQPLIKSQEVCNQCDDDQDGVIDNAFGSAQSMGLQKLCTPSDVAPGKFCPGSTRSCGANGWTECNRPTEVCNGVDDNCNGKVDETPGAGAGAVTLAKYSLCGLGPGPKDCTCVPTSCKAQKLKCGVFPDGCGGQLDCGRC